MPNNTVTMRAPGAFLGQNIILSSGNTLYVDPSLLVTIPAEEVRNLIGMGFACGAAGFVPENRRTTGTASANGANANQSANAFAGAQQIYLHFSGSNNAFNAITAPAANMIAEQGAEIYDSWRVRVINGCNANLTLLGGNLVTFIDSPVLPANTYVDLWLLRASASNIAIYTEGVGNRI